MSSAREKTRDALSQYVIETFLCIETVKQFCESFPEWIDARTAEMLKMEGLKSSYSRTDLDISHIINAEERGEAIKEYVGNKVAQVTKEKKRRCENLKRDLDAVLEKTLSGLKELQVFLEVVEKLAVTSLHVFQEGNRVLHLPDGVSSEHVQMVIIAARQICPLLLVFKRDASAFFLSRFDNVEVLVYQLDRYIQIAQKICEHLNMSHLSLEIPSDIEVNLDDNLTDDDVQKMLCHINHLTDIRMDQDFRLVFLFQDVSCSSFIKEFTKRLPGMLHYLEELEKTAVKLDSMNKGARISGIAGSSLGIIGGLLSIVGLALIPVTAGVSVSLMLAGMGCSVTSGLNSIVTTATEIGVNRTQQKKAKEVLQKFMEDVYVLNDVLDEVTAQNVKVEENQLEMAIGIGKIAWKVGAVGKTIDSIVDAASTVKLLKSKDLITSTGKVVAQETKALRNVPRLASEIPDIGQAALKGPLAFSKLSRVGLIGANVFFLGLDIGFICMDSASLSEGIETKVSKFLRARAELWRSEVDAWKTIHDSVDKGLPASENSIEVLYSPFYV